MKFQAVSVMIATTISFQVVCTAFQGTPERTRLTILLYDYAGLPDITVHGLIDRTNELMAQVGIALEWWQCATTRVIRQPERCLTELRPGLVVLRILVYCPDSGSSRADVVGQAGGLYMSLCASEILKIEKDNCLNQGSLMPYAAVHEIGHLLLGPAHSSSGIMRAVWRKAELYAVQLGTLKFSEAEAESMRRAVPVRPPQPGRSSQPTHVGKTSNWAT